MADKWAKEDTLARAAWVKTVTAWAMEVFCDLFGIMLLGPCFAYAYVEAYDLCAVLDSAGKIVPDELREALAFYPKHPSHYFRIQQQASFLKESAWWKRMRATASHVFSLLQQCTEIAEDDHLRESRFEEGFIHALSDVLPKIRTMVGEVFSGVDDGWNEYSQLHEIIKAYLRKGVVPSLLVVAEKTETTDPQYVRPSALSLLNAGTEFYLTELDGLIRSVPKEDDSDYGRRLHWVRRIEQWIAKAIEDQRLNTRTD